jgi:hypothetical protein
VEGCCDAQPVVILDAASRPAVTARVEHTSVEENLLHSIANTHCWDVVYGVISLKFPCELDNEVILTLPPEGYGFPRHFWKLKRRINKRPDPMQWLKAHLEGAGFFQLKAVGCLFFHSEKKLRWMVHEGECARTGPSDENVNILQQISENILLNISSTMAHDDDGYKMHEFRGKQCMTQGGLIFQRANPIFVESVAELFLCGKDECYEDTRC